MVFAATNNSQKIRFVKSLGIDPSDIPFELFPKKALVETVPNLITEEVAGFNIPVINDYTPSERLLFTAIQLKNQPLYQEYSEVNQDLAEALSLVQTADGSPLVPEGIEPLKFITPDSEFLSSEVYKQVIKSQAYRQFKRENRDLFDEQDRILANLVIRDQYVGRGMAGLFLSIRVDPSLFETIDQLTDEQVKAIVKFLQREGNGGKGDDETESEPEATVEAVNEKNDSTKKSKTGLITTGN